MSTGREVQYIFSTLVNDKTIHKVTQAKSSGLILISYFTKQLKTSRLIENQQIGLSLNIPPPNLESYQHPKPSINSSFLPVRIEGLVLLSSLLYLHSSPFFFFLISAPSKCFRWHKFKPSKTKLHIHSLPGSNPFYLINPINLQTSFTNWLTNLIPFPT